MYPPTRQKPFGPAIGVGGGARVGIGRIAQAFGVLMGCSQSRGTGEGCVERGCLALVGRAVSRSCPSDCCLAVASRVLIRAHSSTIRCSRALHKRNRVGPSGKTPAPSSGMRPSLMARALSRSAMVRPMWSGEWVGGRWVMVRPMWSGGWVGWHWVVIGVLMGCSKTRLGFVRLSGRGHPNF